MTSARALYIELPPWVDEFVAGYAHPLVDDEARMALTVALSAPMIII